jgi:hypothetical protein
MPLILIHHVDICTLWMWALFPICRRYMQPPSSGQNCVGYVGFRVLLFFSRVGQGEAKVDSPSWAVGIVKREPREDVLTVATEFVTQTGCSWRAQANVYQFSQLMKSAVSLCLDGAQASSFMAVSKEQSIYNETFCPSTLRN